MALISVTDYDREFYRQRENDFMSKAPAGTTHVVQARDDADWDLANTIADSIGEVKRRDVVEGQVLGIPGAQSGRDFYIIFIKRSGA